MTVDVLEMLIRLETYMNSNLLVKLLKQYIFVPFYTPIKFTTLSQALGSLLMVSL